jgi:hypothetical protein
MLSMYCSPKKSSSMMVGWAAIVPTMSVNSALSSYPPAYYGTSWSESISIYSCGGSARDVEADGVDEDAGRREDEVRRVARPRVNSRRRNTGGGFLL